ncbi:MAG TPA: DNA-binding protein [Candidatus Methylomirabilis sp.]|nr:DNA-binding protein [Candidatus Methylomirabilis sp.]
MAAALVVLAGCASSRHAIVAIEMARRSPPGAMVTIEGAVTVPPGLFASFTGDQSLAVEDASGGIYVAVSGAVSAPLGQGVRVTGRVSDVAKLVALSSRADLVTPAPAQHLPPPMPVKTGAVGPATEGRLVEICGTITRPVGADRPYGFTIAVDAGSGETQVFVPVSTGIDPLADPALRVGRRVTVVGFSGRYEETHEVIPRFPGDLAVSGP